jgi:two-component system sensor histidine kinase QseC
MSAPTLVLMPLSLALLALALRRGLAPLNALSGDIRALTGRPGERLQKPPHFKEFNSTVHALHGLMQRLEQQIERERAFASDLAHELRTPLTALSLQASQLAQQEVPGAQALQSQALRAGDILSQLLTLARAERMDAASRQTLDLHSLAASTLADMAQLALDHGQELWLEDAGAEVKVQASPLAVDLALRNLIDNALKHTPPGSRIKVGVWRESGQQGLAVEDQPGPGSTPPAPKPGLGLGLQLVQRLAASQNATLEIQSTAGGRRCRLAWAEEPTHTG